MSQDLTTKTPGIEKKKIRDRRGIIDILAGRANKTLKCDTSAVYNILLISPWKVRICQELVLNQLSDSTIQFILRLPIQMMHILIAVKFLLNDNITSCNLQQRSW